MDRKQAKQLQQRLGLRQDRLAEYAKCNKRWTCAIFRGDYVPPRVYRQLIAILVELDALTRIFGPHVPIDVNNIAKINALLRHRPQATLEREVRA